jgi:hypothetical protein
VFNSREGAKAQRKRKEEMQREKKRQERYIANLRYRSEQMSND